MRKRRFFTDRCVDQWNREGARRVCLQAAGQAVPPGPFAEVTGVGGPACRQRSRLAQETSGSRSRLGVGKGAQRPRHKQERPLHRPACPP